MMIPYLCPAGYSPVIGGRCRNRGIDTGGKVVTHRSAHATVPQHRGMVRCQMRARVRQGGKLRGQMCETLLSTEAKNVR